MKIYLSADIEGVACISAPTEADMSHPNEYAPFRKQMTDEVAAACTGAYAAGAELVVVKDAHWTGRNLDPHALPVPADKRLQLIRGWSGHPFSMVQGIDASFEQALFIGYHSGAGRGGNPLSHTVSGRLFARMELNGENASEFRLFALAAASGGVPVTFLSGDRAQCDEARELAPGIATVATLEGFGPSVLSISPKESVRRIREGVQAAVAAGEAACMAVPKAFDLHVSFVKAQDAYSRSFYPGVRQISDTTLQLESSQLLDVLAFIKIASRMT
jgi:D-amino peptidase